MATFQAANVAAGVQPRCGIGVTSVTAVLALTALALNDVCEMVKIPKGATVLDVILASDDIDSNATPLVALDVGDGTTANRFIAASQVGRAGGVARMDQKGGSGFTYTANDTIDIKCQAAPATFAAGNVTLTVLYTMDK